MHLRMLGRHLDDLLEDVHGALGRRRSASTCSPIAISGSISASLLLRLALRRAAGRAIWSSSALQLRLRCAPAVRSATGWPWKIA